MSWRSHRLWPLELYVTALIQGGKKTSQQVHPACSSPGTGLSPELALAFPGQPQLSNGLHSRLTRRPLAEMDQVLWPSLTFWWPSVTSHHIAVLDHRNYDQTPACHENERSQLTLKMCGHGVPGWEDPSACKKTQSPLAMTSSKPFETSSVEPLRLERRKQNPGVALQYFQSVSLYILKQ